ncbi:TetR/AcrR family transcriptional regulator [Corynebacterium urogenitale]
MASINQEPRTALVTPRVTDLLVALSGPDAEAVTPEQRRERFRKLLDSGDYNTKERITLSAVEAIFDQGIHNAPIDRIAANARVSKGAVFYSFGSREKLIRHILGTLIDVMSMTVSQARGDLKGVDALESVFRAVLNLTVNNHASVHTIFSEITRPDSPWNFAQDALVEGVHRPVMEILHEMGLARTLVDDLAGDAHRPADVQRVRITVTAIIGALFLVGQSLAAEHADEEMIDAATAQLIAIAQN